MNSIDDLSRDDLIKVMTRDREVKAELQARIGALMGENIELLCVLREVERELMTTREQLQAYQPSE